MPSASNKPDNKASTEAFDPIKQVITVVEKKVRNLEKRKGKLDQYRTKVDVGEELNKDQQDAIAKYDSVLTNLEFARELQKQFISIGTDLEKLQKKQAKREKIERHHAEMKKVQEILKLQALLDNMGSDNVREDFKEGTNGAIKLTTENLEQLDNIYKLVSPTREGETSYEEQLGSASDHLVNYIEGREKEVVGTTYKDLKELVQKITDCHYFENLNNAEEVTEEVDEEKKDEGTEKVEEAEISKEEEVEEVIDDTVVQTSPTITASDIQSLPTTSLPPPVEVSPQQPVSHQAPQQEVMSSVVPPEADPAVVVAAAQDLVGMVAPTNFAEQDDSFFTTATPYGSNRAFTEIVSSVQGPFNFLQDSHIESQTPHMDPAVVVAQPMGTSPAALAATSLGQSAASVQGQSDYLSSSSTSQQPVVDSHSLTQSQTPDASTAQQQLDYSQVITGLDFGQNQISNSLQNSHNTYTAADTSQTALANQMAALSTDQSVISTPDVPPSIPLPNQASLSTDSQTSVDVQEKKHYSMNPNAVTFQSMYSQPSTTMATDSQSHTDYQQEPPQTSTSSMDNKYDNKYDYQSSSYGGSNYGQSSQQGYGSYNRGSSGSRGGRGSGSRDNMGRGGRGGSGGSSGMTNGYNQRGSGGGRSNNSYPSNRGGSGGYNSNRGGYQGYPPRSDYQPEGGYQGYSNGFTSSGFGKRGGTGPPSRGSGRGSSASGMRGSGPRGGGGMRGGGGGGRGGYGSQRSSQQ